MATPVVVWSDHRRRLVMLDPANPKATDYSLEYKTGSLDAMGKAAWLPAELTWELFTTILHSVVAWAPYVPTPDEL